MPTITDTPPVAPAVNRVAYDGKTLTVMWRWAATGTTIYTVKLYRGAQTTQWNVTSGVLNQQVSLSSGDRPLVSVTAVTNGAPGAESAKVPVLTQPPRLTHMLSENGGVTLKWMPVTSDEAITGYLCTLTSAQQTLQQQVAAGTVFYTFKPLPLGSDAPTGSVRSVANGSVSLGPLSTLRTAILTDVEAIGAEDDGLGVTLRWKPVAADGFDQWLATLSATSTTWSTPASAATDSVRFPLILAASDAPTATVRAASADGIVLGPPSPPVTPRLTRARPVGLASFLRGADFTAVEAAPAIKEQFTAATALQMGAILTRGFTGITANDLRQSLTACAYAPADIDAAIAAGGSNA